MEKTYHLDILLNYPFAFILSLFRKELNARGLNEKTNEFISDFIFKKIINSDLDEKILKIEECKRTAYLKRTIHNFVIDELKKRKRNKKKFEDNGLELNEEYLDQRCSNPNAAELKYREDYCNSLKNRIKEKIKGSKRRLQVFDLRCEGYSPQEIADELHIRKNDVYQYIAQIKDVARELLSVYGY